VKPVRDFVNWYLKKKGLTAVPIQHQGSTFPAALNRLATRNFQFGSVIDVGASDGRWSAELLPHFSSARYLCIEAFPAHEPGLKAFVASHPQAEYVLCAAGDREGEITFRTSDMLGGWATYSAAGPGCIQVPMKPIDQLVAARQLPAPFLIKLDTHGFEVPILEGAARTLEQTEVLIVEVYNFPGPPPALPFYEFCRCLSAKGFRCLDLFDPLYRPHDDAFWQMDLLFARETRPEFSYRGYA